MFKGKKKINIVTFAAFLLAVVAPVVAGRMNSAFWIGEPQLPKKL